MQGINVVHVDHGYFASGMSTHEMGIEHKLQLHSKGGHSNGPRLLWPMDNLCTLILQ